MSPLSETGQRVVEPRIAVPEAPGAEVAGPALTGLVAELRDAVHGLEALYRSARLDARERYVAQVSAFQTDGSGNAAVKLYEVPQGAIGSLVLLSVDEAGVTPDTPDTRATLSLEIYAADAGAAGLASVRAVGGMLDCLPQAPATPTQIPQSFVYGDFRTAPRVMGPLSFFLVVRNANASKQCAARVGVYICDPI